MADINKACSVSKCTTRVDELSLAAAGLLYLNTLWVNAVRAGTTSKCLAHYLDTDIPTTYAAYIKGSGHRGNRDLR
jgi:hypothetical protein